MTTFIWAIIVIGMLFILGSFFVSEKLSRSDLQKIHEVSENEVRIILNSELEKAHDTIRESIENETFMAIERAETDIGRQATESIANISEYSATVLRSVEQSHTEIDFLYKMLNDKQEEITNLTKDLQMLESAIVLDKKELIEKGDRLNEVMQQLESQKEALRVQKEELERKASQGVESIISDAEETAESETVVEETMVIEADVEVSQADHALDKEAVLKGLRSPDALLPKVDGGHFHHNEEILKLSKKGKTVVEIAKELGLGLGEVKLVIDLNKGGLS